MLDGTTDTTIAETTTTTTAPPPPFQSPNDFKARVNEAVKNKNTEIQQKAIEKLAESEITRRQDVLTKAFKLHQDLSEEFKKLGPDVKTFNGDGTEKEVGFSEARNKQRQSLQQRIGKLDGAIAQAVNNANYEAVTKVASSGKVDDDKGDPQEEKKGKKEN